MNTSEIIFEVTEAVEGGYDAKALGHSIFTQGEDWEDLKAMVREPFAAISTRIPCHCRNQAFREAHWGLMLVSV